MIVHLQLDAQLSRAVWELVSIVKYIDRNHVLPAQKNVADWVQSESQSQEVCVQLFMGDVY